jgi:hypothetical protein
MGVAQPEPDSLGQIVCDPAQCGQPALALGGGVCGSGMAQLCVCVCSLSLVAQLEPYVL